ncbi:hypothetical protein CONPUDRAFT_130924 [Coniophora puteana RWD-64-598 SS2]|uniref:Methyltransferase domain-containing protein n=1 Tax=Coniophora puteana (strain RWD-64-598) TaxID=741705 RepID=A0A5M3MBB3_CONPW|nr:uncharacterized protein CONPUDRAFT_130924 [Coniophora puteana RWD-64-598 SS2]EIW76347.1 hypothetical protein CONPUDRAFT_130924 [Coniophora puteana RWD-64-598 SS2]
MSNSTPNVEKDYVIKDKELLDDRYYNLKPNESAFFKAQTGITDDNELKKQIIAVQKKAYEVFPYWCIVRFAFTQLKISSQSPAAYAHVLKLGRERPGAILIDAGCCFGNDARKPVLDGFPAENVVAFDLHQEFWDLGHELFKSNPQTFPAKFIAGDVFDDAMLSLPDTSTPPPSSRPKDLSSITSVNPLRGHVSAIHASAFFHLFSKEKQADLASRLAGLLSAEPGSIIFGAHAGLPEASFQTYGPPGPEQVQMFCHSRETWKELWDGVVFPKGTVEVKAELEDASTYVRPDLANEQLWGKKSWWLLKWSVMRL